MAPLPITYQQAVADLLHNHVQQIALARQLEELEQRACDLREMLLPLVAPGEVLRIFVSSYRPFCVTLYREGDRLGNTFAEMMTFDDLEVGENRE